MTRWPWAVAVLALGVGASCNKEAEGPHARAQVRKVSGSTMEVIPSEGQLPYCLLYTVSQKGIIRQLTMTRENRSIKCEAGKPIAHSNFRVPVEEGPVKVYIFFSDQRIQAGSVSLQLSELQGRDRVTGMDFRLPGQAFVEMLEFTPEEGGAPVTGGLVGAGGEVTPSSTEAPPSEEGGSTEQEAGGTPAGANSGTPPGDAGT